MSKVDEILDLGQTLGNNFQLQGQMGAGIHCVHNCERSLTGDVCKQVREMSARNCLWKAEGPVRGRWMGYTILPGVFCERFGDVTHKKLTKGNTYFLCVPFMDILNECFPKLVFKILLVIVKRWAILLYGHNQKMFVVIVLGLEPCGGICHSFYQENTFFFNGSMALLLNVLPTAHFMENFEDSHLRKTPHR